MTAVVLAASVAALADPCDQAASYDRAVCFYREGRLTDAAAEFLPMAKREASPEGIRAFYFLARIRMKEGRWKEASVLLAEIYHRSPDFYRSWSCDFLLGECRRAMGKG